MDVHLRALVKFDFHVQLATSPGHFTAGERAPGTIIFEVGLGHQPVCNQQGREKSSPYSRKEHQSSGLADSSLLTILTELPIFIISELLVEVMDRNRSEIFRIYYS